jgi:selenide,water dikinase
VKVLDGVKHYLGQRIYPDATSRNWSSYGSSISFAKGVPVAEAFMLLPDPQTNGGLLFTVKEYSVKEVQELLEQNGLGEFANPIGRVTERKEKTIYVI